MAGPSVNRRWPARGGRRGIGGVGNGINAHSAPQTPRQARALDLAEGVRYRIRELNCGGTAEQDPSRLASPFTGLSSPPHSRVSARRARGDAGRGPAGPGARARGVAESRRTVRTTTRKNNIQCNHAVRVFAQTPSPFRRGRAAGPACVDLACAVWLCPVACGLHACTHAGTACGPRLSCARWRCRAPPRAPARGPAGRRTGIGADWRDVNWRW